MRWGKTIGTAGVGVLATLVLAGAAAPASAQAPPRHQLSVLVAGPGTVVGQGIDCGRDCVEIYPTGTRVELSAVPQPGYELATWGGDCSGAGPCSVTMSADRRVTAQFRPATPPPGSQRLEVSVYGGGVVTSAPAGIDCGSDCSETLGVGTQITLTGTPHPGFRFAGWRGGCSGAAPSCALTLDADAQVEAGFVPDRPASGPLHQPGLIVGTDGNDVLEVSGREDTVVYGLGGDDRLIGGGRSDVLIGGIGEDRIVGGNGRDVLLGDSGDDALAGSADGDTLVGGIGRDRLEGGSGGDRVVPGSSAEAVAGGAGNDTLVVKKKPSLRKLREASFTQAIPYGPPIAYAHGPFSAGNESVWRLEIGAPGDLPAENEKVTPFGGRHPSWSPTGLQLAYQVFESGGVDYDIAKINHTGNGYKNLTQGNGADDVEPAWSPDGKRIAFVRDGILHTMKANGSEVQQLTPSPYDANPSWAPDGQSIYFARNIDLGDLELCSIKPDGSGFVQLTGNEVHDDHPELSPDGEFLAWDAGVGGGPGEPDQPAEIILQHLEFPFPLQPAPHPEPDVEPTWSPNSKRILFHSQRGGYDLWVVNLNGTGLQDVTSPGYAVPGHDIDPDWGPW